MDKLKGKAISCKIAGKYFLPAVIALAFSTGAMQASEKGRTSFDVESVTHSQQERELTGVVTGAHYWSECRNKRNYARKHNRFGWTFCFASPRECGLADLLYRLCDARGGGGK